MVLERRVAIPAFIFDITGNLHHMFRHSLKLILFSLFPAVSFAQGLSQPLQIRHLTDSFFVYTTYRDFGGNLFPSNSMYLVTNRGILMFDTPWDTTQLQPLLDSMLSRHGQKPRLVISTHYHDDRVAGVSSLDQAGVTTLSTHQTRSLAAAEGNDVPAFGFATDTTIVFGGYRIETFYPGKGHTEDNIVIWFPDHRILYGGCFVKSTQSKDLGNTADADPEEWARSVRKLMGQYPEPEFVIPGHFSWDDPQSLKHTLKLIERHLKQEKKERD